MAREPGPSERREGKGATFTDAILGSLKRDALRKGLREEMADLYRFYVDEERRERLAGMSRARRGLWLAGWLARSLVLKLSPVRRLLLLASVILVLNGRVNWPLDLRFVAWGVLLIVLMLELKDKLLARDEIEVAREVQLSLLPREHPRLQGWEVWSTTRPANEVGGDLVDYVSLGEGRLGVVLGDVAGKGLGAALLCAKLQASLRALAPAAARLADLGSGLNGIIEHGGMANRYVTLFYCEITRDSGEVRYLNAGHNPALVVRGSGLEELKALSVPLGMLPDSAFVEARAALEPGDVLLVYSDGLSEARSRSGEEFGAERIRLLAPRLRGLGADAAGRLVVEEANRFLAEGKPHDDLSVVVLRRAPRG